MSVPKIVECVPNFSEGRNKEALDAIADAIRGTEGCSLLDVEPGTSTNRTVFTFCGSPNAVVEGALQSAKAARKYINMAKHHGEHPCMGAMDVCPFIPVSNVSMEECVAISWEFGARLANDLNVPVYLYEEAQEREYRRKLPQIRKGEYEGLAKKLQDPEWVPDFGPAEFVSDWGATVTGARKFLIAFNVNIFGTKQQAHRIALDVRESGRGPSEPGLFKEVQGLGWYLEEHDIAQVSLNLCDFNITSLHTVYEECCKIAKNLNVGVAGSEVVGLIPLAPLLMAAEYYMAKENLFILHEHQKIRLVVDRLGLNSISQFKPQEKIIEYCTGANKDGPLLDGSVRKFVEQLGDRTSSPGGGSASACIASMGAALGSMVGLLTYGNRKYVSLDSTMRKAIRPLHDTMQQLLQMIDKDTQAFTAFMDALQLPKKTDEEKAVRQEAIQAGLHKAIEVPLAVIRQAACCWPHLVTLAEHGNISAISDVQVAAHCLYSGQKGAYYNVEINMKQIQDKEYKDKIMKEVDDLISNADNQLHKVLQMAQNR